MCCVLYVIAQVVFLVEALAESPRIARLDLSGNHLSDNVSYLPSNKIEYHCSHCILIISHADLNHSQCSERGLLDSAVDYAGEACSSDRP